MKIYCEESTIDYDFANRITCRLWLKYTTEEAAFAAVQQLGKLPYSEINWANLKELAEGIATRIPNLNAIQVIHKNISGLKIGHMLYLVPFDEKEST